MNAHGLTSLGMAIDMIGAAIKELQATADHQLRIEHLHRWKDTHVKLSQLSRIRRELLQVLGPDERTTTADLCEKQARKSVPYSVEADPRGIPPVYQVLPRTGVLD